MHLLHWNILVMPYAQSTGAVISGNFSNALLTWCRMASLKLCCSLQPLLNQDWLWWCFNTLLHCSVLPTEVKVSSVLQVPPGWVFPAFVWKTIHLWPWKVCSTLPCRFPSCGGGPRPCFLLCEWYSHPCKGQASNGPSAYGLLRVYRVPSKRIPPIMF